jgi:GntR family transcriptional regulator
MIQIVTGDPRPLSKQIVDGFRLKIITGVLAPGSKIPSVRGLAMQLMINTNTVARAYGKLTEEGLVEARKGLGLFVCPPRQLLSDAEREKRLDEEVDKFINGVIGLDYATDVIVQTITDRLDALGKQTEQKG